MKQYDIVQIFDGETVYLVNPQAKAVITDSGAASFGENMIKSLGIKTVREADSNFITSGTEAVDGTEYAFEEYKNESDKIRYYFDSETMRYIKHIKADGSESLYKILQISKTVPDEMFNIPQDYNVINGFDSLQR